MRLREIRDVSRHNGVRFPTTYESSISKDFSFFLDIVASVRNQFAYRTRCYRGCTEGLRGLAVNSAGWTALTSIR